MAEESIFRLRPSDLAANWSKIAMKSLYDSAVYDNIVARINNLSAESKPQWGRMSVGQMLAHCAEIGEVFTGDKALLNTPFIAKLFKGLIRKGVLNETPYKRSLQTHPQYKVTADKSFDRERSRLLANLAAFHSEDQDAAAQRVHPLFGTMTPAERGWAVYKHLDHHLTQFGV